jgi:signal transduction histidine kinase
MAVPVVSRSGEAIGGLFFGHSKPGIFTEREERIVAGLASQAAIAMDNARLFENAKRAVKVRDEFLSISSHELRTPLTPLKMQLQGISRYLKQGSLSTEQLHKMLDLAEKQVNRLTALVEDLLDVSRISAGKLTLNREEVDAAEVVREVMERYLPQLQSVKCEATVEAPALLLARVDRLRFEQVLINLLTNAMKYAAGSPVRVSLSSEGAELVLRVRDGGRGISPEDQAKIFGRFERVQSTEHFGGLGLGLFIVRQIVAAHGGSIQVESSVGRGATFVVRIPVGP